MLKLFRINPVIPIVFLTVTIFLSIKNTTAQEAEKDTTSQELPALVDFPKLKVFLDCAMCDLNYIKEQMPYLDYVWDPKNADVHVLVRTQQTGSGGTDYEMEFFGKGSFERTYNRTGFSTFMNSSVSEEREIIYYNLINGLTPFWGQLNRDFYEKQKADSVSNETSHDIRDVAKVENGDKWNLWVYQLGGSGSMSGEESSKTKRLGANLLAKRVTEKNKFALVGRFNSDHSEFNYGPTQITSIKESNELTVTDVVSLGKNWSVGAFLEMGSSDFYNQKFNVSLLPAIEYSFFPYSESSKKQLTLSYRVGGLYNNYKEMTVFLKEEEFLWENSLNLGGAVHQKWGSVSGEVSYESFLNDMSLYAVNFYGYSNFRLFKGFSVNFSASYSITNNQINLAGGDLSIDELLLRQQQIKSGYNFFFNAGISYSFGSMYNTVVNPRFGF